MSNEPEVRAVFAPALWKLNFDGTVTYTHAPLRDVPDWLTASPLYQEATFRYRSIGTEQQAAIDHFVQHEPEYVYQVRGYYAYQPDWMEVEYSTWLKIDRTIRRRLVVVPEP